MSWWPALGDERFGQRRVPIGDAGVQFVLALLRILFKNVTPLGPDMRQKSDHAVG
jgi:hypothetical protein